MYSCPVSVANEKAREFERRVEALQTALTDAETRIEDQKAEHAVSGWPRPYHLPLL